ncbi:DNA-directed RNA polymerase sigma-70 factor [Bacteroidia bacterium]|nr:DNA-directed RNA polymerase sigma-70 factor [Bacteroidia bacterium]
MRNVNDHFYIRQVKTGNFRAFSGIVQTYQPMVLAIIRKMVESREDAEDIAQEVFIKVFKSLAQFREEAEFSTWLYRIAYNTTLSELRKRKLSFVSIDEVFPIENETVSDDLEAVDTEKKLHYLDTALKQLPPDEIFLITLYYLEEQPIEAISQISQLTVSNVKVKLHRIRKKLALEINKRIENEDRRFF